MSFVGAAVGCPLMGIIDDRFQLRRQIMVVSPLIGAVLMSVIVFVTSNTPITLFLLFFLLGICGSSYMLTFIVGNELASQKTKG